jgi:hypothetical protein
MPVLCCVSSELNQSLRDISCRGIEATWCTPGANARAPSVTRTNCPDERCTKYRRLLLWKTRVTVRKARVTCLSVTVRVPRAHQHAPAFAALCADRCEHLGHRIRNIRSRSVDAGPTHGSISGADTYRDKDPTYILSDLCNTSRLPAPCHAGQQGLRVRSAAKRRR